MQKYTGGYILPKNYMQNYTGGIILRVGIFLPVTPSCVVGVGVIGIGIDIGVCAQVSWPQY